MVASVVHSAGTGTLQKKMLLISRKTLLSEKQKAELYIEAGIDITEQLFTEGYYFEVSDPGADVRAVRGTPIINVWYTYGGSVNKLNIPLTAFM